MSEKTPKLTIKQEKFCNKYIECGNASEAYRYAYDCGKMMDKSVWEKASELLKNVKVSSRVSELQRKLEEKSDITKERVLQELKSIGFSEINKNIRASDKISALSSISKMLGYDAPSKSEVLLDTVANPFAEMRKNKGIA